MENNLRLVVDTNLLLSAALISGSAIDLGIQSLEDQGGVFVFSEETFSELKTVITRKKFNGYRSLEERQRYVFGYQKTGLFVIPERHFFRCRDARDNKFLDVAVAGNVEALITGDKDLLVLENIEGIPILGMADFLKS